MLHLLLMRERERERERERREINRIREVIEIRGKYSEISQGSSHTPRLSYLILELSRSSKKLVILNFPTNEQADFDELRIWNYRNQVNIERRWMH